MSVSRRVWDSCVIIDYLAGASRAAEHCPSIIDAASRDSVRIVVSTFSHAEVVKLNYGIRQQDAEPIIEQFFRRPYIQSANIDPEFARIARELVRLYPGERGYEKVRPPDAVQVATALRWQIPVFESYDHKLIDYINAEKQRIGQPLILREPDSSELPPVVTQTRLAL